MCSSAGNSS